jgi:hypothetical protein
MASANEPGVIQIIAISPTGQRLVLRQDRSDSPINAGKSPDGVLANLTIDKQMYQAPAGPWLKGGVVLAIEFTFDGTDGLDVSDGVIQVPITFQGGLTRTLNATDFGNTTDLPAASVGTVRLGAGYTIPNGQMVKFGGGPIVVSVEDDTA